MDSVECSDELPEGVDYTFDPYNPTSEYADIVKSSTRYSTPPVDLEWRNLTFSVPLKRNGNQMKVVLHPMSGHVRAGHMLAVFGSSGAGKSTLLNLLSGRVLDTKGATADGNVFVNGQPREHAKFRQCTAYVMQDDDMFAELTVREQIGYAAALRLPNSMTASEKEARVDRLIRELGLEKVKNSRIGGNLVRGISGGERKRVSIATELVTDPSVIFLDEPTSGQDAFAALKVMQSLRFIASSGRTVVTTIHQPRSSIFQLFDQLLLLSEGRVMFFGNANKALDYFSALSFRAPPHFNPSDYFLDILSVDRRSTELESRTKKRIKYFAEKYESFRHLNGGDTKVEKLENKKSNGEENCSSHVEDEKHGTSDEIVKEEQHHERPMRKYRNPWLKEIAVLLNRGCKLAVRERTAKKARLIITAFMGIVLGLMWQRKGQAEGLAARRTLAGILFFVALNVSTSGVFSSLFQFPLERGVLMRERAATMYRTSAYYLSRNILDMLTTLAFNTLSTVIIYWTVGLRADAGSFFRFLLALFLTSVCGESLALTLSISLDSVEVSTSQIRLIFILCILFGGFFIEQSLLSSFLSWFRFFSFIYYGFGALSQIEFPSNSVDLNDIAVRNEFGLSDISYWMNIIALAGQTIVVKYIGYLALEYLRGPRFFKF